MSERPILFSGPMVRALLDGRKTQTRRVLKPQPPAGWHLVGIYAPGLTAVFDSNNPPGPPDWTLRLPFMPKDRLWVREAWRTGIAYDDLTPSEMGGEEQVLYEVDGTVARWWPGSSEPGRLRNARHMPRWASRLTLTVTDVRVQRVQEISWFDAEAEGCHGVLGPNPDFPDEWDPSPIEEFRTLWDSLNAARGHGWDANPWVVALTFTARRANIDQMGAA